MVGIRQLTDVSACKLHQYLPYISRLNLPTHVILEGTGRHSRAAGPRPMIAGNLAMQPGLELYMASELSGPDSVDRDTWTGLSRLAAQAAHVLEVSDKIASGGSDGHDDEASLRESMQDELGGLRAAIDYVIGRNELDWAAVNRQRDRRRAQYERRTEESPAPRDKEAAMEPAAADFFSRLPPAQATRTRARAQCR
jgi:hypothetical protein